MTQRLSTQSAAEKLGFSATRFSHIDAWLRDHVDAGRLPGAAVQIIRHGEIAYQHCYGLRDIEAGLPIEDDTIYRIYSMTKPITTVAMLMLYEQGAFQLDQRVADFIPAFQDLRVYRSGPVENMVTEPLATPVTIHHLLTHTSGLTYGFLNDGPVGQAYRNHEVDFIRKDQTLADTIERLCQLPLAHQPGARWSYSVSFDVLGYLVEVISGESYDHFLRQHVLQPLGMNDTAFQVSDDRKSRFAALYGPAPTPEKGLQLLDGTHDSTFAIPVKLFSGGGGLTATLSDYQRFVDLLLRRGAYPGGRLLGRKTFDLMVSNHMGGDLTEMGQPSFSETTFEGIGFGLGMSVMLDPAKAKILGSPGEFAWGGAASTAFWVDPAEDLSVILMTQLLPSSTYPLRRELRVLSYQALID